MKYYRDIDYFLFFMDFPHMGVPGAVAGNSDATVNIYINTLYTPEIQKRTVKHELRHLVKNHFQCDWMTIEEKELEADDVDNPDCVFADDFSYVEYLGEISKPKTCVSESRLLPGEKHWSVFRSNALPDDVTFGFYVPDNSLRPALKKGQLVYCDDQQLKSGDIGLFLYHGETMCRQYHKDMFGMTYLFALDRKRSREDIVLRSCEEKDLVCLGRVRAEKRYSLPVSKL